MQTMNSAPADSFGKRSLAKVAANCGGFLLSMVTQAIVPRALGPAAYGDYSFVTSFFWQTAGSLNCNSSTAFYTKLSGRRNDRSLVYFYSFIALSVALVLVVLSAAGLSPAVRSLFWPGQVQGFLFLGAVWAGLAFWQMISTDMADAYALTARSEFLLLGLKACGVVLLVLFFFNRLLDLGVYYAYQICLAVASCVVLWLLMARSGVQPPAFGRLSGSQARSLTGEFADFCLPLVTFTIVAACAQVADRWFVQRFSGSIDQGFFALALQISSVCFLFTSAVMPLILREQAISFERNDREKLRRIFFRSSMLLYVLTSFLCCFIAAHSRTVLLIFGGRAFDQALPAVTLMCLYPIHQTYGQINANFFFATGRVKVYRTIGIALVAAGLCATFWVLGPRGFGGLQAGAAGLAVKMVVLQIVCVNIQLWFNAGYLKLAFSRFLIPQLAAPLVFWALALAAGWLCRSLCAGAHPLFMLAAAGCVYAAAAGCLVFLLPGAVGLEKQELERLRLLFRQPPTGE